MCATSSVGSQGIEDIAPHLKPTHHTISEDISSKFSGPLIPEPT